MGNMGSRQGVRASKIPDKAPAVAPRIQRSTVWPLPAIIPLEKVRFQFYLDVGRANSPGQNVISLGMATQPTGVKFAGEPVVAKLIYVCFTSAFVLTHQRSAETQTNCNANLPVTEGKTQISQGQGVKPCSSIRGGHSQETSPGRLVCAQKQLVENCATNRFIPRTLKARGRPLGWSPTTNLVPGIQCPLQKWVPRGGQAARGQDGLDQDVSRFSTADVGGGGQYVYVPIPHRTGREACDQDVSSKWTLRTSERIFFTSAFSSTRPAASSTGAERIK